MMGSDKLLLSSIFSFFSVISAQGYNENDLHVIKSAAFQGLVVDGSDPSRTALQFFSNSSAQLWKFQPAKTVGLYYIVNSYTGKALDFHPAENLIFLVQRKKSNKKRQEFSVKLDGRIVNRENRRAFDILESKYNPGTLVHLWYENGEPAQEFLVENLNDVDFEELKKRIS